MVFPTMLTIRAWNLRRCVRKRWWRLLSTLLPVGLASDGGLPRTFLPLCFRQRACPAMTTLLLACSWNPRNAMIC
jgi:hypothetical protein